VGKLDGPFCTLLVLRNPKNLQYPKNRQRIKEITSYSTSLPKFVLSNSPTF
jgi:hypothetical protein